MAEASIGKANLKLGTDVSAAKRGLEQFGGEVKGWIGKQKQALAGQFNAALRGGLIGGFVGGSLQAVVQDLVSDFKELVSQAALFRLEMERAEKLGASLAKLTDRRTAEEDKALAGITDDALKMERIAEALDRASTESLGLERNLKNARQVLLDLAGEDQVATNWNPANWLGTPDVEAAKARLKEMEDAYGKVRERVVNLTRDLTRLKEESQIGIPPWLNMALGVAGNANRMLPQDLPGWSTMLNTLSQVAGVLPKPQGLTDWIEGALNPFQGMPPFLSQALNAATSIAETVAKAPALKTDNAALVRGSSAEISARIRNDSRAVTAAEAALREAQAQTKLLGAVAAEIGNLADNLEGLRLGAF
jgi:hypothetical protein